MELGLIVSVNEIIQKPGLDSNWERTYIIIETLLYVHTFSG